MNTITVQVPNSISKHAERLASQEGISLDQFVSSAIAEKLAALDTERYLRERAERGRKVDIDAILAKVPAVEPKPADRMPGKESGR